MLIWAKLSIITTVYRYNMTRISRRVTANDRSNGNGTPNSYGRKIPPSREAMIRAPTKFQAPEPGTLRILTRAVLRRAGSRTAQR